MNFPQRTTPQPLPDATPHSYVVVKTTVVCRHCSTLHESCQVMLRCELEARNGMGKPVVQMKRLEGAPQWNLPITIMAQTAQPVPFCHECLGQPQFSHHDADDALTLGTILHKAIEQQQTAVSHLPPPPQTDKRILRPSADKYGLGIAAKASEAGSTGRAPSAKPRIRSADDLLAELD